MKWAKMFSVAGKGSRRLDRLEMERRQSKTRKHWVQRITFAAETNAAVPRAVATGWTDRNTQTHAHTHTSTTTTISSPRKMRRKVKKLCLAQENVLRARTCEWTDFYDNACLSLDGHYYT